MLTLPEPLSQLVAALNQLPGIGPRSAERLALHLVERELGAVEHLAQAILVARQRIQRCPACGALTELVPCAICSDSRREPGLVCVVERPVDIISLEKSNAFRGRYHVLGGKISPTNGIEPEDLRIAELEARVGPESLTELVIALPTDVEGDATSYYLAKRLAAKGLKVTRIAHGLPAGSALEFADDVTLTRALEGRREIQ